MKTFNHLLKSFLYSTLLKSKMLAEVLIHDKKGKGPCTSVPQNGSDAPCRKPGKNQKFIGFSFLGSFFNFSVCVLSLFMNLTSGTSSGLPVFCFLCLSSPLSYKLFQICFANLTPGFIFHSRPYSGLSTLLLMAYFIILLTIFHYASAVLLKPIRKIITFLCLSRKLA